MLPDAETEDTIEELSDAAVVAHSGSMAVATLISRITGFVKILLLSAVLGQANASAFSTANQLPNLIAALVLEATFTAIFVPVLTRAEREDADGGDEFIRKLLTIVTTLLLVTTAIAILAAPKLTALMLGGHPKVNESLTTALAYLLLPMVFFYGLSSVFMAILNTRNVFAPTAWAPVCNNIVAITTLVLYALTPGEITLDPVRMSDPKLLVLGVGTTLGVVTQVAVLVPALRRQGIPMRPLWGIDDRLKRFAGMAAAMMAYVVISQIGLIVTNRIAAGAADSGPVIYNNTWLILQLPYGVIGVTVLTAIMPRLSRNAAADDTAAVLDDMSLATRLTFVVLIPVVAVMTVAGPPMGPALFAYGHFAGYAAGYLGSAISWSAFTILAYALVLLQLRVFYARHEAWTPTLIIIAITAVKIIGSVLVPHLTNDPNLVAAYLGTANGIGFVVGAAVGYVLLRRSLGSDSGPLIGAPVLRTVGLTTAASAVAALIGYGVDSIFGLETLTTHGGGLGSLLRLTIIGVVMLSITGALLVAFKVPEANAVVSAVQRRIVGNPQTAALKYPDSGVRPDENGPTTTETANDAASPARDRDGRVRSVSDNPGLSTGALPSSSGSSLVPGSAIADGRYRLLTEHGGPEGLHFWQATDTELNRPVALTVVDGSVFSSDQVQDILSNTLRLTKIEAPGLARVLDAVREGAGGIVVAQWVRGGSLREVADTEPSPLGASRALRSLAAAADAADQAGGALSIDHPDRVRISIDGNAVLAFPATLPEATPETDVRGLGAALYALTTRRWPLRETGAASGLDAAPQGAGGLPVEPKLLVPTLPADVSDTATHALGDHPGTAEEFLSDLEAAVGGADHTTMLEPAAAAPTEAIGISSSRPGTGANRAVEPDAYDEEEADEEEPDHRRSFLILLGVLAVVVITVFVAIGVWVSHIFGGALDEANFGKGLPTSSVPSSSVTVGAPVRIVKATVFNPGNDGDHPDKASLAIDGDSSTGWTTDVYSQPDPFPDKFKSGVGLILDLSSPSALSQVTIESPSVGTRVQIRSATSSTPTALADTTEISANTTLQTGKTQIPITSTAQVSHVLVWINVLGSTNGESRAELSEITVSTRS